MRQLVEELDFSQPSGCRGPPKDKERRAQGSRIVPLREYRLECKIKSPWHIVLVQVTSLHMT